MKLWNLYLSLIITPRETILVPPLMPNYKFCFTYTLHTYTLLSRVLSPFNVYPFSLKHILYFTLLYTMIHTNTLRKTMEGDEDNFARWINRANGNLWCQSHHRSIKMIVLEKEEWKNEKKKSLKTFLMPLIIPLKSHLTKHYHILCFLIYFLFFYF